MLYLRKIDNQCINRQISFTQEVREIFLDGRNDQETIECWGKNSNLVENVKILTSTDPRFDNGIKRILNAEGNGKYSPDDIMVMYKLKDKYIVELVRVGDSEHAGLLHLIVTLDSTNRHQVVILNKELDTSDIDETTRLKCGVNVILYGVPGSGKSYTINNEYIDSDTSVERVVFHPDYTYSDFIGQILPKSVDDDVAYEFTPGPFTKILKDSYRNPTNKYILVIEEINRGNAPSIFGDVFQLLDRDKETFESEYSITNSDIAKIVYNDETHKVKIPSNMSIICTMNTSDQNVFTLDTAFQRRWAMRMIENKFNKITPEEVNFAEKKILDSNVSWESFCNVINKQILEKNQNMSSSEDKRLGVYFVNIDELTHDSNETNSSASAEERRNAMLQNRRFPEKVIKYLWDDAFKFNRYDIFKEEFMSLEKLIDEFCNESGNNRFNIFQDDIKEQIENN